MRTERRGVGVGGKGFRGSDTGETKDGYILYSLSLWAVEEISAFSAILGLF